MEKTYLGDGVYAEFDGFQIILEVPTAFATMRIALEPDTFHALQQYAEKIAQENRNDAQ